jgi:hypothetical protein
MRFLQLRYIATLGIAVALSQPVLANNGMGGGNGGDTSLRAFINNAIKSLPNNGGGRYVPSHHNGYRPNYPANPGYNRGYAPAGQGSGGRSQQAPPPANRLPPQHSGGLSTSTAGPPANRLPTPHMTNNATPSYGALAETGKPSANSLPRVTTSASQVNPSARPGSSLETQTNSGEKDRLRDKLLMLGFQVVDGVGDPNRQSFYNGFLIRHSDDPKDLRKAILAIQHQEGAAGDRAESDGQSIGAYEGGFRDIRDSTMRFNRGAANLVPGGSTVVAAQAAMYGTVEGYDQGGAAGAVGRATAAALDSSTHGMATPLYKAGGNPVKALEERTRGLNPATYVQQMQGVRTAAEDGNPVDAAGRAIDVLLNATDGVKDARNLASKARSGSSSRTTDRTPQSEGEGQAPSKSTATTGPAPTETSPTLPQPVKTRGGPSERPLLSSPAALPTASAAAAETPPVGHESPGQMQPTRPQIESAHADNGSQAHAPSGEPAGDSPFGRIQQRLETLRSQPGGEAQANANIDRWRQEGWISQEEAARLRQGNAATTSTAQQIAHLIKQKGGGDTVERLDPNDPQATPHFHDGNEAPQQGRSVSAEEAVRPEVIMTKDGIVVPGAENPMDSLESKGSYLQINTVTGAVTVIHGPEVPNSQKARIRARLLSQNAKAIEKVHSDYAARRERNAQAQQAAAEAEKAASQPPTTTTPPSPEGEK